jgi:N-acetylglucosaminyldiphosphoundecaprenol N-acetyl-beta-D-mannosaminyltransferase
MHSKVNILGVQISNITNEHLLESFTERIGQKQKTQVCITPVNSVLAAIKDPQVLSIYNASEYVLCDGTPIKWAAGFLNTPIVERITGLDLLPNLVAHCAKHDFSIFLLGASPGVGEKLKEKILTLYPNCKVVGVYVPPFMKVFSEEENIKMIDAINAVSPDVLLVSLTAPKQDIWIAQNLHRVNASIQIGIGGAFEVMAGLAKRAPKWMHAAGLEWLYRFIQEPKRLFRRYFIEAPLFIPLIIKQKLRGKPRV